MTDDELAAVEQAVVENTGGPVPRATVLDLIARVRAAESACAGSEEHCDQLSEDRARWKARAEKLEAHLRDLLEVAHPHARESPGLATVAHMAHAAVLNVCGICAKPLNQGDRGSIDCGGDCQECMDRHEEDG